MSGFGLYLRTTEAQQTAFTDGQKKAASNLAFQAFEGFIGT